MKDNLYDKIMDKTYSRIEKVSDRISHNFKNVKPFNKEPISEKDMLDSYGMLTSPDMEDLIKRYGYDEVNDFIGELELLKAQREMKNGRQQV